MVSCFGPSYRSIRDVTGGPRNLIVWNFRLVRGNGDSNDGRKGFGSDCNVNTFNERVRIGIEVAEKGANQEWKDHGRLSMERRDIPS